jgi:hypothetical protein
MQAAIAAVADAPSHAVRHSLLGRIRLPDFMEGGARNIARDASGGLVVCYGIQVLWRHS